MSCRDNSYVWRKKYSKMCVSSGDDGAGHPKIKTRHLKMTFSRN